MVDNRLEDMTHKVLHDAWSTTLAVARQTSVRIPEWVETFDDFDDYLKDHEIAREEILRKWDDGGRIFVEMLLPSHGEMAIFNNWLEAKTKLKAEQNLIDTGVKEAQTNYKDAQKVLEDAEQEVLKDAWGKIQVGATPKMREGRLDWLTTFDAFEASLRDDTKADILEWWRVDIERKLHSKAELSITERETLEQWRKVRVEKLSIEVDLDDANADVSMATPEWLACKKKQLNIIHHRLQGWREEVKADIKRLKAETQRLKNVVKRKSLHRPHQHDHQVLLSDLLSGTIITMWADLKEFGFTESKQDRWFVVLGKLANTTAYVLLPMATFQGTGTCKLDDFTAEYFKDLKSNTYNHSEDIFFSPKNYRQTSPSTRRSADLVAKQYWLSRPPSSSSLILLDTFLLKPTAVSKALVSKMFLLVLSTWRSIMVSINICFKIICASGIKPMLCRL